ncbi:MAG TPA: protocatechuate 3,4-dioxygenase subunit alpha [Actinophytocola sp.]|uniref:protocatechuate 3,4-dioxygenase subunit alpha n=1 Tax=Actinophytocola sp. TaxID=1872138 RepID=UPI002DBC1261|nr:protocatechuate 3,4-dioxygenase subunit alpha [Actinophytocola sp.]HEU5474080.1 protocatechuate 3,4-dioxygenase subunit alpha [Actinophytocola sp.]
MTLGLTPSQTVGPFFAHCLPWPDGPYVVDEHTPGAFWLRGRITDGAGEPVPDGLVESWQADPDGRFAHPDDPRGAGVEFRGFGRCPTDAAGYWAIRTLRPGRVPDAAGRPQAPHIDLSILGRGLLDRLVTRVYLPDEPANAEDPVLAGVDPARRGTLIAVATADGFRFDVRLRGDGETVFFSV